MSLDHKFLLEHHLKFVTDKFENLSDFILKETEENPYLLEVTSSYIKQKIAENSYFDAFDHLKNGLKNEIKKKLKELFDSKFAKIRHEPSYSESFYADVVANSETPKLYNAINMVKVNQTIDFRFFKIKSKTEDNSTYYTFDFVHPLLKTFFLDHQPFKYLNAISSWKKFSELGFENYY